MSTCYVYNLSNISLSRSLIDTINAKRLNQSSLTDLYHHILGPLVASQDCRNKGTITGRAQSAHLRVLLHCSKVVKPSLPDPDMLIITADQDNGTPGS